MRGFSLCLQVYGQKKKKEEPRHFCDYGDPTITSLYVFNALQKYHVEIPEDVKEDLIDVLDFLSGAPDYESLKND